jgi:hypothetical protein
MQSHESIRSDRPDELEEKIIDALGLFKNIEKSEWKNKQWTDNIKKSVEDVLKERGYKIRAWLYDLTGIEEENGCLRRIPLVLESEWKNNKSDYLSNIQYDFEKLLVSRADHKILVLEVSNEEEKNKIIEQLLQCIEKVDYSMSGDRYLFACWKRENEKEGHFDCPVYVVS